MEKKWITVMGSFVADLAFRAKKLPGWGETLLGSDFKLGPGGKGSNQAVAAARLGARVSFMSQLGNDAFGELARSTYREEGIDTQFLFTTGEYPTGAASIIVDEVRGENSIVVVPGACFHLSPANIDKARGLIADSSVFMTQLELNIESVGHGLKLAKSVGVPTILNPAPALPMPPVVFPLCDYLTPNESEAAGLTGIPVASIADAERAADKLLSFGSKNIIVTLGAQGAFIRNAQMKKQVPAFSA
jgi:ribokinase